MQATNIKPYIGNPVVKTQEDMMELIEKLNAIEPFYDISLMSDKFIIRYIGQRTFRYPAKPTIDNVVAKFAYMQKNTI